MARRKISKPLKKKISRKISKVSRDDPSLTQKQVVGKSFGILRNKGVKIPKKRGG